MGLVAVSACLGIVDLREAVSVVAALPSLDFPCQCPAHGMQLVR